MDQTIPIVSSHGQTSFGDRNNVCSQGIPLGLSLKYSLCDKACVQYAKANILPKNILLAYIDLLIWCILNNIGEILEILIICYIHSG